MLSFGIFASDIHLKPTNSPALGKDFYIQSDFLKTQKKSCAYHAYHTLFLVNYSFTI
jgi:hypothetical protein